MAETTFTGADLRQTSTIFTSLYQIAVADVANLRPLVKYRGDVSQSGANAVKTTVANLYSDKMAAANTNETTNLSSTILGDSAVTITAARQGIFRDVTDMFFITGEPDIMAFIQAIRVSAWTRFTELLCGLFAAVTNSAGTANQPFTVDDFYSALNTVEAAGATGPFYCVLNPTQFKNLRSSLRSEQIVYPKGAGDMLNAAKQAGYRGDLADVQIWVTSQATTGMLFDYQAFGYVDGIMPGSLLGLISNKIVSNGDASEKVWVEIDRDAAGGETFIVGNWYVGVGTVEEARACEILSGV